MQTRHAGQYGALLVFESKESIDWEHAEEAQFFSQFEYPDDTLDFSEQ